MSDPPRRLADLMRTIPPLLTDRIVPALENTGENNTVRFEKDDFKPEITKKLADFAASLTTQAQNEFPLTSVYGKISTEDYQGNPVGIRPPGENDQAHYTEKFSTPSSAGISAEALFQNTSHSGFLDVQNPLTDASKTAPGVNRFVIKKGKSSVVAVTGTEIYQDINEKGESSDFVKRVRQAQFDNNRFTLGKTYVPRTGLESADGISVRTPGSDGSTSVEEDESNIGVAYSQQEFGKHGPRKFPDAQGHTATLIKIKDLKKIGLLTMLQASGEYYIPKDPNDAAQILATRGASLAPGLARIGQKIDVVRISPINIMKGIDPNFQKPTLDDNIKRGAVLSYGSVNNWITPFAGLSSTASIACAALLALSIGGLIKAAALLLSNRIPSNTMTVSANPSVSERRRRLGSFLGKTNEVDAFRNTDLEVKVAHTEHPYFQCVSKGIDVFFGTATLGATGIKIAQNHGYYNTVLRSLVRGTTDFIKMAAGGIVNPEGVRDVNDVTILGNPLGPVELLQKVNSSQLLKFCNVLATIGDLSLAHQNLGYSLDADGEVDELISDVDRIITVADVGPGNESSLNPSILQSVNRLGKDYRNALAWGSNTVKSMYMFPNGVIQGESVFTGGRSNSNSSILAAAHDLGAQNLSKIKDSDSLSSNRISAADVASMEEHLDADYMPFYFHDIRTNEIIAFHAFLEEMNDSFDVEYTDTSGYGRIGDVHIYKNTKRSISLGFRVVATNQRDFDHMWWKINKLITLIYPQYTEGRQVGTDTNKFVQPFSQVPSASPLIRLRLGDVFKSNYTKFGLARLFGVGTSQFAIQGQEAQYQHNQTFRATREATLTRMNEGTYNVGEHALLLPMTSPGSGASQIYYGYPRVGNTTSSPSQPNQPARRGNQGRRGAGAANLGYVLLSPNAPISAAAHTVGPALQLTSAIRVRITRAFHSATNNDVWFYDFVIPNGGAGQDGIYGTSMYCLRPDNNEANRIANTTTSTTTSDSPTNTPNVVGAFFSAEGTNGNPIVKAFESTKGKGLAGFIKSMKFDWSDARWETGRQNARAPMSLKINIEFLPIFDLNPGLDSEGFMTAPVYNIGDTMKTLSETPEIKNQNDATRASMANADNLARPSSGNSSTL